jgi:hypothetical protein
MSVVFFIAYILFLLPILLALAREWDDESHPETALVAQSSSGIPMIRALSIWIAFLVMCYVMLSHMPKIKRKTKSHAMHVDDILRLVFFGSALFTIGGVGDRIERSMVNRDTGLSFIPLTLYFTLFFTLLFELIKHENVTLSKDLYSNTIAIAVVVIGASTLVAVVVSLFFQAKSVSDEFFHTFAGLFLLGSVVHAGGFLLAPLIRECYVHSRFRIWSCFYIELTPCSSSSLLLADTIHVHVRIPFRCCHGRTGNLRCCSYPWSQLFWS